MSIGVFVIDFHNQRLNGDFKMNPVCYPNVSSLVQRVKEDTGARTMVSIWPDVHPGSYSYDEMSKAGCVVAGWVDPTSQACRSLT